MFPEFGKAELRSTKAWRATLAEFVATLLFIFVGAGTVIVSGGLPNGELGAERLVVIALAHGLTITVLAYTMANISDGHINPVVTLAAVITKKMKAARGLMFITAQLVAVIVGASLWRGWSRGIIRSGQETCYKGAVNAFP